MYTHKIGFERILKSKNIPKNHYQYLHIKNALHISFKNEMFAASQKSKILIVRLWHQRGRRGTGVEINLPQLGPRVKLVLEKTVINNSILIAFFYKVAP